ncbi:hypothetical protein BDR26DRAFT_275068 [Obelidium mucronatum]|nr:hypothetical protein BDR26DRAFT_275068 [Obelidium mucronatum]
MRLTHIEILSPMLSIVHASFTMASLSIIKLIWLIQFIVKHEVIGEGKKLTLQNVFTPFSTILFLMITCLFCLYAVKGIGLLLADTEESIPRGILFSIEHFCSTAVLPCYVYYSYLRAGPIFDEVYPYTSKLVSRMVKLAPLLYFAQWIPFPLSRIQYKDPQVSLTLNFIADTISAVNGVLLILFDIVCLTVFIQYLRSTQINEGNTDSRFLIISRYGIMSTIGALSSLGYFLEFLWCFFV